ncbi:MAG: PEP-CTERM sorting domain-containing protein [Methyloprofundus sp.]|nr:PEP-CTERM sorting domain-containing protein [Methyloprofundus sp.]
MTFTNKALSPILLAVASFSFYSNASASIIQADFRSDLKLVGFTRVLERTEQVLPNAGFELGELDEISNPRNWNDSLQVDLDPLSNIVTLTPSFANIYDIITISISNMLFDDSNQVTGFSVISSGSATTFDSLTTSFTNNSVNIQYIGDNLELFETGSDTFQITLGPANIVPEPSAIVLMGLGIWSFGAARCKQKKK